MPKLTDAELLAKIENAERLLSKYSNYPGADSILRQLIWGRRWVLGEAVEPKPGPFSMGFIAIRQFDGIPEIADIISVIESELEAREPIVVLSNEEKRRRKKVYKQSRQ